MLVRGPFWEREIKQDASEAVYVRANHQLTNTKGESAAPLIKKLAKEGFSLNVTAILTLDQVRTVAGALDPAARSIVSVFAGRIADTGLDPMPMMTESAQILSRLPKAELLWASSREFLNVIQAEQCGCHIITATPDIISKLPNLGKDLRQLSLETVKTFYEDARASGFKIV